MLFSIEGVGMTYISKKKIRISEATTVANTMASTHSAVLR